MKEGKKIAKERNFYPGYVLIEASLNGEAIHALSNLTNVIGFLGGNIKPIPLRQSEVNRILGKVDELKDVEEEVMIPYP